MSAFAVVAVPVATMIAGASVALPVVGIILEGAILAQALAELGFKAINDLKMVRGMRGCTEEADIVFESQVSGELDIGFRKTEEGHYECIADWDALEAEGMDRNEFISQVNQKYTYLKTLNEAQKEGYNVVEETTETDGSIRVILRKYE